ncbi:MAG: T9SS type A sorting domain-containing protein [Bacteroidota bacterium]
MQSHFSSLLLSLLLPLSLLSQTQITNDISSNTTWDLVGSPYQIMNDIAIDSGITLTINPGVHILCHTNIRITVNGSISAIGTATDSIYIRSMNQSYLGTIGPSSHYDWKGFRVAPHASLDFAFVMGSHAFYFIEPSSIFITPTLAFHNCLFTENNYFIYSTIGLNTVIDSCLFNHSVRVFMGIESFVITNSVIQNVGDPIDYYLWGWNNQFTNCSFLDTYGQTYIQGGSFTNCYFGYEAFGPIPTPHAELQIQLGSSAGPTLIEHCTFIAPAALSVFGDDSTFVLNNNQICASLPGRAVVLYGSSSFANTLDLSNNCWCDVDTAFIHNQVFDSMLNAPAINVHFLPIDSSCLPTSVYPGDANHNQIANHNDLLPIGLYYGHSGPNRPNASLSWTPQAAAGWGDTLLSTGVDIKHADCDGNGIINDDDTLAIHQNYLQTHTGYKTSSSTVDGIPLFLDMPSDPLTPGDTLSIPIILGTVDTPAIDMYGLAFSIEYDSSLIKQGKTELVFSQSWLGTKGSDLLTLYRDIDSLQQIDIALVRNDQMDTMGLGQIARIIVVIDDDIFKKEESLILRITNVQAIDVQGQSIDLDVKTGISTIQETDTSTSAISSALSKALEVYPNPTEDEVVIRLKHHQIRSIVIYNAQGQICSDHPSTGNSTRIKLEHLPKGLYVLKVHTESGEAIRKLMIR